VLQKPGARGGEGGRSKGLYLGEGGVQSLKSSLVIGKGGIGRKHPWGVFSGKEENCQQREGGTAREKDKREERRLPKESKGGETNQPLSEEGASKPGSGRNRRVLRLEKEGPKRTTEKKPTDNWVETI